MLNKSEKTKIVALVNQAILKVKEDRPELKAELEGIVEKLSVDETELLKVEISDYELEQIDTYTNACEDLYLQYAKLDTNNLEELERIKKEFSSMLMYLSSYKDKLVNQASYIEDVFKKEVSIKLAKEIEGVENISFTQAEKKINLDERYNALRKKVSDLNFISSQLKTKYDFFSKVLPNIVQSISIAVKEKNMN